MEAVNVMSTENVCASPSARLARRASICRASSSFQAFPNAETSFSRAFQPTAEQRDAVIQIPNNLNSPLPTARHSLEIDRTRRKPSGRPRRFDRHKRTALPAASESQIAAEGDHRVPAPDTACFPTGRLRRGQHRSHPLQPEGPPTSCIVLLFPRCLPTLWQESPA